MRTIKLLLPSAIACLMFASGTRAQSYKWDVTHSSWEGVKYEYSFSAIDSWGNVVMVAGIRQDTSLKTNDRNVIIFCRSTDGGETWTEQDPGLPHFKSSGAHFISKIQQIDSLTTVYSMSLAAKCCTERFPQAARLRWTSPRFPPGCSM